MYHRIDWAEQDPLRNTWTVITKCGLRISITAEDGQRLAATRQHIIYITLGGPYYCPDCFADNTIGGASAAAELGPLEADEASTPAIPVESPYESYL